MAKVGITMTAHYLIPNHAVTVITNRSHVVTGKGQPEAGPAGPGIVLMFGAEQLFAKAKTRVGTIVFIVDILATERPFGCLLLRHLILLFTEALSQRFVLWFRHFLPSEQLWHPALDTQNSRLMAYRYRATAC